MSENGDATSTENVECCHARHCPASRSAAVFRRAFGNRLVYGPQSGACLPVFQLGRNTIRPNISREFLQNCRMVLYDRFRGKRVDANGTYTSGPPPIGLLAGMILIIDRRR